MNISHWDKLWGSEHNTGSWVIWMILIRPVLFLLWDGKQMKNEEARFYCKWVHIEGTTLWSDADRRASWRFDPEQWILPQLLIRSGAAGEMKNYRSESREEWKDEERYTHTHTHTHTHMSAILLIPARGSGGGKSPGTKWTLSSFAATSGWHTTAKHQREGWSDRWEYDWDTHTHTHTHTLSIHTYIHFEKQQTDQTAENRGEFNTDRWTFTELCIKSLVMNDIQERPHYLTVINKTQLMVSCVDELNRSLQFISEREPKLRPPLLLPTYCYLLLSFSFLRWKFLKSDNPTESES